MISLDLYKKMNDLNGKTTGQFRKKQSDRIMENTWNGDIQSRLAYLYDYFHDDEKTIMTNLNSSLSESKRPVEIKFIISTYNSANKDFVAYEIQFKPSYNCDIDYYENDYAKKYNTEFPIGLYIDIPDLDSSVYRKWLIISKAKAFEQFNTYYVLPCDYKYQWIYNGQKIEMCGVQRTQSSYNSGVWRGDKIEIIENQTICLLPYNKLSQTLFYNQRLIISAPVDEGIEPLTWRITKVENSNPIGIYKFTFAQDKYDQNYDYIERDENGTVIGMWANYYQKAIETPIENESNMLNYFSEITINSQKPIIKVGGSPRIFTVTYFDEKHNILPNYIGNWDFFVDEENLRFSLEEPIKITEYNQDISLSDKQIKLEFISEKYIGKEMKIVNTYGDIKSEFVVKIAAL